MESVMYMKLYKDYHSNFLAFQAQPLSDYFFQVMLIFWHQVYENYRVVLSFLTLCQPQNGEFLFFVNKTKGNLHFSQFFQYWVELDFEL